MNSQKDPMPDNTTLLEAIRKIQNGINGLRGEVNGLKSDTASNFRKVDERVLPKYALADDEF